jgi:SAM-dependent methyltransferase
MDPVLDVDWAAHWRGLVEAREAEAAGRHSEDFWDRLAPRFAASIRTQEDPFAAFLQPWLDPRRTLLDVGAGVGRHTGPMAARLDWVTAVEPSERMREQIPRADNVTVIGSTWEDAEPAPADLVICVHVLYSIADPVPFLHKLERHARERVFVVLRDSPQPLPAEQFPGPARPRQPRLRDCFMLLRQVGVAPDLTMFSYRGSVRFTSLEEAVEDCRLRLGAGWDERSGLPWLESRLRPEEGGTLLYDGGEVTSGVLHWKPRS